MEDCSTVGRSTDRKLDDGWEFAVDCSPVHLIGTMGVCCGLLTSGSDRYDGS